MKLMFRLLNRLGFSSKSGVVDVRFNFLFTQVFAVNFQCVVRFAKVHLPVFNLPFLFQFVQVWFDLRSAADAIDVRFKNVLAHNLRFKTLSPHFGRWLLLPVAALGTKFLELS
jgi:hypothetical protein